MESWKTLLPPTASALPFTLVWSGVILALTTSPRLQSALLSCLCSLTLSAKSPNRIAHHPCIDAATAVQYFRAVASLEANASDLGQRIRCAQQDALREKRQGQKRASLVHVRRMKQFQAARDKRLSSLYTLETALHKVGCMSGRFRCIRVVFACLVISHFFPFG